MPAVSIRPARPDEIPQRLDLIDIATEGFVARLFLELLPPGSDVPATLRNRMETPDHQLSLTRAQVAEHEGRLAGLVMTADVPDPAEPVAPDTPPMLRPLFELETLTPGTTLINVLATLPDLRGKGIGSALIDAAERRRGKNGLCLNVLDTNLGAQRLYSRLGFREVARRGIVKLGWETAATDWVLMARP